MPSFSVNVPVSDDPIEKSCIIHIGGVWQHCYWFVNENL